MPMHMCIALVAAQRHDVNALGRKGRSQSFSDIVDHLVYLSEQNTVPGYVYNMLSWRNNRVPAQSRVPAEECNDVCVGVDQFVVVIRIAA